MLDTPAFKIAMVRACGSIFDGCNLCIGRYILPITYKEQYVRDRMLWRRALLYKVNFIIMSFFIKVAALIVAVLIKEQP